MNPQTQPRVREASVFDYGLIVLRHWVLVLLICVPAVVGTAIWSFMVPLTYRATTSIVPPLELMQGGSSLARGLLGGMEGAFLRNMLKGGSVSDLYAGILDSRVMADTILDRFNLMEVYGQPQSRWRALQQLAGNTEVKVTKDGIVKVSVVDRDPNRAAAMANAYIEELDLQNKRLSMGQATSKRVFLEHRLKEIEARFSRIESIPSHEAQVQKVLYELLVQECELAKIEEARSMPTIQVLDKAVPPDHKYGPVRKQMVMKAAVGAFALAVFLACVQEYRSNRGRVYCVQRSEPTLS